MTTERLAEILELAHEIERQYAAIKGVRGLAEKHAAHVSVSRTVRTELLPAVRKMADEVERLGVQVRALAGLRGKGGDDIRPLPAAADLAIRHLTAHRSVEDTPGRDRPGYGNTRIVEENNRG